MTDRETDDAVADAAPRTVAVLGTGVMGAAMARNLLRAGFQVVAWNRDAARAEALRADGASVAGTAAQAVAQADAVLTMLFDGASVIEVMTQAAAAARPGTLWVQSTTVAAEDVAGMAELAAAHGLVLFEAPVMGTKEPAEQGTLVVLGAGPVADRARVVGVLDAFSARVLWVSEDAAEGKAARLKLAVNAWLVISADAAGEVAALAQGLGLEPQLVLDAIEGGVLDQRFWRTKTGLVASETFSPPSMSIAVAGKDARLIVTAAQDAGLRLDALEAVVARFDRVAASGHAQEDMAALYRASFGAR